ncbi:MAG: cobalamin-binding protein, partial [Candidatus Accumulibacter sp.]|nr:cobalamin-binding protein [Accumulibacter sp.]
MSALPATTSRHDMNKLPVMNIGAVERDTGLGKDTLRVWERRY